ATGEVNVVIQVNPGPLHRIAAPRIHSPDGRGVEHTAATVQRFVGRAANTANLNAMRSAVEESFTSQGYPDARILIGQVLESPRYVPDLTINLGTRVRLNEIRIEGLRRTNPGRIA